MAVTVTTDGGGVWCVCVCVYVFIFFVSFSFQTEIAKRLNAICAQIIPFLSQEVRLNDTSKLL